MWKCHQLVCHDLLDVVHSSKMTTFEVEFEFWENEEVTWTHVRWVRGLWNHWNTLFGQKSVHGDDSVAERCCDAASKCPQSLAGHNEPFF